VRSSQLLGNGQSSLSAGCLAATHLERSPSLVFLFLTLNCSCVKISISVVLLRDLPNKAARQR